MADVLMTYLRAAARKPFAWGVFDCCLFFADWIKVSAGLDPAADLRGTYSTEREMRRLVKAAGGLERLVGDCMAGIGWRPTSSPRAGDIGLVRIGLKLWGDRLVMVPAGAIAVSAELWAVKPSGAGGLTIGRFPVVRAWSNA